MENLNSVTSEDLIKYLDDKIEETKNDPDISEAGINLAIGFNNSIKEFIIGASEEILNKQ